MITYSPGNVPTFSLLEDRLDDGQPPQVSITFPDGYTDTLILNHYFSDKDQIENGNYLGHLANEKDACVAMTGRVGSEDVEFTILSNHASESNMYKWKKDGTVENMKSRYLDYEMTQHLMDSDYVIADRALDARERRIERRITSRSPKPPTNQRLQIRVLI